MKSLLVILWTVVALSSASGADPGSTRVPPTAKEVIASAGTFVVAYLGPEKASRLHASEIATHFNSDKRQWTTMFASEFVDGYVMVEMDETASRAYLWTFSGPVLRSDHKGPDTLLTLAEFRAALSKRK